MQQQSISQPESLDQRSTAIKSKILSDNLDLDRIFSVRNTQNRCPFVPIEKINVMEYYGSESALVERMRTFLKEGKPIVLAGLQNMKTWKGDTIFEQKWFEENFGNLEFYARNNTIREDLGHKVTMTDYLNYARNPSKGWTDIQTKYGHISTSFSTAKVPTLSQDTYNSLLSDAGPPSGENKVIELVMAATTTVIQDAKIPEDNTTDEKFDTLPPALYAKDLDCPEPWKKAIADLLPSWLLSMRENDLFINLPQQLIPENYMIYVGIGDTWTPGHKDICSSLGHNLMIFAEPDASSFWFMTRTADASNVATFWQALRQDINFDNYFANPYTELANANFDIYVTEQKAGDFIIVPSDCCHQVVNKGGITMKVAWNRITAETLEQAINYSLPIMKSIFRPETYRVKSVIYHTIKSWTAAASKYATSHNLFDLPLTCEGIHRFREDFILLLNLFKRIIADEWIVGIDTIANEELITIPWAEDEAKISAFGTGGSESKIKQFTDSGMGERVCDFCKCDIWNRQYYCELCKKENEVTDFNLTDTEDDDPGYNLCLNCYAAGRTCVHMFGMELCCYISMNECLDVLNNGFNVLKECLLDEGNDPKFGIQNFDWLELNDKNYNVGTTARRIEVARKIGQRNRSDIRLCRDCRSISINNTKPSQHMKCDGCGSYYCHKCLYGHYKLRVYDVWRTRHWLCPECINQCSCITCQSKFGRVRKNYEAPPLEKYFRDPAEDARNWGALEDPLGKKKNWFIIDHEARKAKANKTKFDLRSRSKSPKLDSWRKDFSAHSQDATEVSSCDINRKLFSAITPEKPKKRWISTDRGSFSSKKKTGHILSRKIVNRKRPTSFIEESTSLPHENENKKVRITAADSMGIFGWMADTMPKSYQCLQAILENMKNGVDNDNAVTVFDALKRLDRMPQLVGKDMAEIYATRAVGEYIDDGEYLNTS